MQVFEQVKELAEQFGLDVQALQCLTNGVISRINYYGIERFKAASPKEQADLINKAVMHYHESFKKFHNDVLNNKDGIRDELCNDVYNTIRENQSKK